VTRAARPARKGARLRNVAESLMGAVFVVAFLVTLALGLAAWGASRWRDATDVLLAQLEATRLPALSRRYDALELEGLPPPVQRYFRTVLRDGQPIVTAVRVEQAGTINLSASGEQWKPFTARQRVVTRRPGFVWDAAVQFAPGVTVHVHDAYVAGEGVLEPSVMGLYALSRLRSGGALGEGELMRYFAEAAWYPTALLPSQGVRWQAVDDRTANATLTDGPLSVTMRVGFNDAGLMDTVTFAARGALQGQTMVMLPWEGRWSNYAERNGMRVPLTGEVAWLTPAGRRTYWRGSITQMGLELAP
jgi:hypothetical protein